VNQLRNLALALFATIASALPAVGQLSEKTVMAEFAKIEDSVIRIKTISDLEYRDVDSRSGATSAMRPYSVDGTGVVVGETWVDGRLEYLILTNHHVADASNYVLEQDGVLWVNPTNTLAVPSVHEESYLMRDPAEYRSDDAIELVELVRQVRGDMTLMRTVGANREMTVFRGPIGYSRGGVAVGDHIVTSGYPFGRNKVIAGGSVLAIDYPHDLGLDHEDIVISMPVQPGQSGGPVFRIEGAPDGGELTFRLIGLVHAKDAERSFAVPYDLWEDSLESFPTELKERMVGF
jgi:hypothetical protein